jgi:PAS domain S-box-containing protein
MLSREDYLKGLNKIEDREEQLRYMNTYAWDIRRSYPRESLKIAGETKELATKLGDKKALAYSYRNSGTAYYLLSSYDYALTDLNQSLTLFGTTENQQAKASIIRTIGNIYHSIEENEKSIECYREALDITKAIDDLQGTSYNLGNIGYVYTKLKQYDKALEYMGQAYDIISDLNDGIGLADVMNNMGAAEYELGNKEKALELYERSLKTSVEISHVRGIASAYSNIAEYHLGENEVEVAITHFEKALTAAKGMGEKLLVYSVLKGLAEACEQIGKYKKALNYFKQYEELKSEVLSTGQKNTMEAVQAQFDLKQAETENEIYRLKNTELKTAYQEIEAQNKALERLSLVASKTENLIMITDAEGNLEWVNDSFVRLNQLTMEEVIAERGRNIRTISNNPEIGDIIDECMTTKKPIRYISLNITHYGERIWESSTLTPVYDDAGKLKNIIIIDSDVTQEKLAQEIIDQKNKDITDSINYARRIQDAILPDMYQMEKEFHDSFVFYKPRDVVSGDFYWYHKQGDYNIFAVADCTGHGVPGAFMSMIGNDYLTQIVTDHEVSSPAHALHMLDEKIRKALKQTGKEKETHDGMDIALCAYNPNEKRLQFSGAKNPLYIIRKGELIEHKGSIDSIGGNQIVGKKFEDYDVELEKGDNVYIFTDGYADQFGGPKNKKFMYKRFKQLLISICDLPFAEQEKTLESTLYDWMGDCEQVDDICVMGIKVK